MEAQNGFKVFQMNDCDWYVGRNAEEAKAALARDVEVQVDQLREEEFLLDGYPEELSEEQLDQLRFRDEGTDGEPITRTFREQMLFAPPTKAEMFASTEY